MLEIIRSLDIMCIITSKFPFGIVVHPLSNYNVHFEILFTLMQNAIHQIFIRSLTVLIKVRKYNNGFQTKNKSSASSADFTFKAWQLVRVKRITSSISWAARSDFGIVLLRISFLRSCFIFTVVNAASLGLDKSESKRIPNDTSL
jgi:hypothetical protein